MLVALLILTSVFVAGLLIVFFTTRILTNRRAVPVTLTEVASRPANAALGFDRDPELPGSEDVPDLAEPQLEEVLSTIAENVARNAAQLDDRALDGENFSSEGLGRGDRREMGIGGEGIEERVPRAQRWRIRYQGDSIEKYALQLDYFGVELAVLGQDNKVHYAYNLSNEIPDARTGSPEEEGRLYMTWRSGPLQSADIELLGKAGISAGRRPILQFYPPAVEAIFLREEKNYSGGRDANDIRRTTFGVKQDGNNYSFYVVEQWRF